MFILFHFNVTFNFISQAFPEKNITIGYIITGRERAKGRGGKRERERERETCLKELANMVATG
jgi:hypothetical protein